jgi:hypothetical protein
MAGSETITAPHAYFDGNKTGTVATNPWNVKVPFNTSTDAIYFHSDVKSSQNLSLYIADTKRTLPVYNTGSKEVLGLDTLRYLV